MNSKPKISDRLRAAIRAAGVSLNHMAGKTGVATSVLSRFVRGEQGIGLHTADAVAEYLELDLVPAKAHRKGR